MAMSRGRGLLGRRRFTWIMAVVLGTMIGFAVAGFPDPRTFSLVDERVPVTVAPGALQSESSRPSTGDPGITDETAEVAAADITLALAEATEVPGVIGRYADELAEIGYDSVVLATTDPVDLSRVYFAPGSRPQARLVALELGISVPPQPIESAPVVDPAVTVDVLVIVGRDFE
jgi:hypothetical protein